MATLAAFHSFLSFSSTSHAWLSVIIFPRCDLYYALKTLKEERNFVLKKNRQRSHLHEGGGTRQAFKDFSAACHLTTCNAQIDLCPSGGFFTYV